MIGQLKSDQNGKCYLCERLQITDFQVEHHRSRKNHPDLTFDWSNLFWCCSYCNGRKSSSFDNLLKPTENNIEDLIHQSLDFPNAKAIFSATDIASDGIEETTTFLEKIFNGASNIRTIREQQFYDYAVSKITNFQGLILSWLNAPNENITKAIVEELDIKSEFLGFKYWIIKSNDKLLKTFGKHITWHKR